MKNVGQDKAVRACTLPGCDLNVRFYPVVSLCSNAASLTPATA